MCGLSALALGVVLGREVLLHVTAWMEIVKATAQEILHLSYPSHLQMCLPKTCSLHWHLCQAIEVIHMM